MTRSFFMSAAQALYHQMDRIDMEALQAGQIAQDPEEDRFTWVMEVAKVIEAAFASESDTCPECGTRKTEPHDPYVDGEMGGPWGSEGPCKTCGRQFWVFKPEGWNGDRP